MPPSVSVDLASLASGLELPQQRVERTLDLLDEGNTVAFIARYRKDQTGGLDEEPIRRIQLEAMRMRMLAERKQTILKSIESQGKLTPELSEQITSAHSTWRLEDIYLPYKPKKQTPATMARQRGLEPFVQEILEAAPVAADLDRRAADFVCPDRQLHSVAEVLHGVGHLLAERFSEKAEVRSRVRSIYHRTGMLVSTRAETPDRLQKTPDAPLPVSAAAVETAPEPENVSEASLPPEEIVAQTGGSDRIDEATSDDVAVEFETDAADAEVAELLSAGDDVAESVEDSAVPGDQPDAAHDAVANRPASATPVRSAKTRGKGLSSKERKRQRLEAAFREYAAFRESISHVAPHRVLAINRGERAKALRVRIEGDSEAMGQAAVEVLVPESHPHADFLRACVADSLQRIVLPNLEREIRRELTEAAEEHAVQVFVRNLRKLLLQRPLRGHRVLAIDPGFRTGCRIAALDDSGNVLEHGSIAVSGGQEKRQQASATLVDLIRRHALNVIAIGNGATCRDAEQLVAETINRELTQDNVAYVVVNAAGAGVYASSPIGREESPEFDAALRSAVSIGRRLLDPLSELVKIHPSNIGVGLYQHDVKAKHLHEPLDAVVQSCVNLVGVDANTAGPSLLSYVSGLNQLTARRFYDYRREHGPFRNREQFRDVPGISEAAFIQAAGFLMINGGDHPLDSTRVHPESYSVAQRVLEKLNGGVAELYRPVGEPSTDAAASGDREVVQGEPLAQRMAKVSIPEMAKELGIGEWLLKDLVHELGQPGRDPREDLDAPLLRRNVLKLEDLQPGMELSGTVLNVVDFGAFVDIGISDRALVHISRLADHFIRDPHDVVSVGDVLRVWVVEIDRERRRVALTAVRPGQSRKGGGTRETTPDRARSARPQSDRPARRSQPAPSGRSGAKSRPAKPRPAPKPKMVKPITEAMAEGREPLRSFSDLMQFYQKKQQNPDQNKPPKS